MTRTDRARLADMLESIERIEQYAAGGYDELAASGQAQDAVLHRLQIIGEAASKLSRELRAAHPHVPWQQIIDLRHILVHDYDRVALERIWLVIERRLPELKRQLQELTAPG